MSASWSARLVDYIADTAACEFATGAGVQPPLPNRLDVLPVAKSFPTPAQNIGQNQRDVPQVVGSKRSPLTALGTAVILETEVSKLPDFEGLAIFAKVVQARSFVGAATELRLSKATVSKAVGRIEAKFGTRLFNRSARRLALTEAGRALYDRAAQILADSEAVENEAIAHAAVPRGNIRLAAPISFGVLRIAPILPEFLTHYPDITIDLNLSDTYVDLVGEGYDAAIRIASLPDSSLMGRTLAPVYRYLVAAPSYLSKYGRPSHPLRLSEHRCIAYVSTLGETWHFSNAAGETATVRPVGPFRVNNGDAILPALTAGMGIGILPDFIVHEALTDGRLEIVLPEWTSSSGSVHWLTPPGGRRPKRVEVLGDFFQRRLSSKRLSGKD